MYTSIGVYKITQKNHILVHFNMYTYHSAYIYVYMQCTCMWDTSVAQTWKQRDLHPAMADRHSYIDGRGSHWRSAHANTELYRPLINFDRPRHKDFLWANLDL